MSTMRISSVPTEPLEPARYATLGEVEKKLINEILWVIDLRRPGLCDQQRFYILGRAIRILAGRAWAITMLD